MAQPGHKLVVIGICFAGFAGPVAASEFCVTCSNPDASYACTVDNQIGATGEAALKLFCITEIAKAGLHASCTVDKAKVAPCEGQKHTLKVPGDLDDLIPGAGGAPAVGEAPTSNGSPPPPVAASPAAGNARGVADTVHDATTTIPKTSPPATVEEAVKDGAEATEEGLEKSGQAVSDAAKSAGSALEKAGSAVGDAAKKSWHCLKSLFSDC